MNKLCNLVLCVSLCAVLCGSANILTVVPAPSISHQVVFRPLTQELARRGHQVTVITTDPAFPKGQAPENLTEIDLHESYTLWRSIVLKAAVTTGDSKDLLKQMKTMLPVMTEVFEQQVLSEQIQNLLKSKPKFDLLILEACTRQALLYSHIFKDIPVVLFSSFGGLPFNIDAVGAPNRPPLLYPTPFRQRLYNLTLWEKIYELYMYYNMEHIIDSAAPADNLMLKRIAGEDTPSVAELQNNVDLLMLNVHPMWDSNRPVPPSVVYVGGIHQKPSKELPNELARRGHQVTVITTDPAFPKGQAPENLTEIDLHESYTLWRSIVLKAAVTTGDSKDLLKQMKTMLPVMTEVFEQQVLSEQIQNLLKSKPKFDLLILEACTRQALLYSHIFKDIPVVLFSSFGGLPFNIDAVGAPNRPPLLYPTPFRQRLYNLTLWEKIYELYMYYNMEHIIDSAAPADNLMLKRIAGEDTPSVAELQNNVDLLMLNVHPMWDSNRPVPPSVVYVGGIHQKPSKELPNDLKSYLDSSKHGVIYISYGTNVSPSQLPPEKIQILTRAFSKLRYDVLWKWDKDVLPDQSSNIRISKWLPQSDLLKHPKIKLFITQGGLQSTDEAIIAGVPLIGMPMLGDQWYNVEQYVRHEIGIRLDMEDITEESFLKGVNTVINDDSYRQNIARLRVLMYDQPESALDRAVWWTEHVLRHGGGRHLRAPAANLSWAEYLDADLLVVLAAAAIAVVAVVSTSLWLVFGLLRSLNSSLRVKAKLQ